MMTTLRSVCCLVTMVCLLSVSALSQSSQITANDKTRHILDRMDVLYGSGTFRHASIGYPSRRYMIDYLFDVETSGVTLSTMDLEDIYYLYDDNNEWTKRLRSTSDGVIETSYVKTYVDSTQTFYTIEERSGDTIRSTPRYRRSKKAILKHFYKTPANFLDIETESFYALINPIINFKLGKAIDNDQLIFQNTRGFEIRGAIDNKVYFYTSLFENQRRFNDYIEDRIERTDAIPGQGFFKTYESSIIDDFQGWDFLNAQAYVGFHISKHVDVQFGHGKHFIGNGYHSLLLSDYGHNYFYLQFKAQFWKVHYQNVFAELSAFGGRDNTGNRLLPKKYLAAHYLDFNFTEDFSVGFFEAVVFNRVNNFEFQYLNPVIIYRTVEQFLDSPDNVLIGLNARWNWKRRFQLYGQFIFDEFKFEELSQGNGWWANKYGFQLGLKYMNVLGIDHLDGQIEFNQARPYLYAHRDTIDGFNDTAIGSYSHYNQPLAHPLGANFREWVISLCYQPMHRLIFDGRIIRTQFGDDAGNENWGGDILKSYESRERDFNNAVAQGVDTQITLFGLDVSYQLFHNVYADLHLLYRKQDSDIDARSRNTRYIGAGIRMNMSQQRLDY